MINGIEKRKYTTKTGLEALEKLMGKMSERLNPDINEIESDIFECKFLANNGFYSNDIHYQEWYNYKAYFKIITGDLKLFSVFSDNFKNIEIEYIKGIDSINFKQCSFYLSEMLERYQKLTKEKDQQIENFLKFASGF